MAAPTRPTRRRTGVPCSGSAGAAGAAAAAVRPAPSSTVAVHGALQRHFGYPGFRPGQEPLVQAVLEARDALGILPTGGGKSVCYMLPASLLPGLTLVVSPLISLMEDQVQRAGKAGIPAALLNSTQSTAERSDVLERARAGRLKLLFLAPERFHVPAFRDALQELRVSLLAVDEAHCISQWGHDFRPPYRDLGVVRERVGCPTLALTATATPKVREDIAGVLRLRRPVRVVGTFDRPNLAWEVRRVRDEAERRKGVFAELLDLVRRGSGAAVVYAGTRRTVEVLRDALARLGLPAAAYHGGMPARERSRVQEAFMEGRHRLVVATNAFGMGVDKPDVRLVVHWQLPGTLEAYYQEAGRAGRDGDPARCLAFVREGDMGLQRGFIDRSRPPPRVIRRVHRVARRTAGADRRLRMDLPALSRQVGPQVGTEVLVAVLRILVSAGALRPLAPLPDPSSSPPSGRGGGPPRRHPIPERAGSGVPASDRSGPSLVDVGVLPGRPDLSEAATLRRSALAQLRSVEAYALSRSCRRRTLMGYFGEELAKEGCSGCDRCLPGPPPPPLGAPNGCR